MTETFDVRRANDILNKAKEMGRSSTGFLSGSDLERFIEKIEVHGDCWMWSGQKLPRGYGLFYLRGKKEYAHRVAYMAFVDIEIPRALVLDHYECDEISCANPFHLLLTTQRNNAIRGMVGSSTHPAYKDHCLRGHPRTAENTYVSPQGSRQCRVCRDDSRRRSRGSTVFVPKLTDEDVIAIRASSETQDVLGARYGVHPSYVSQVRRGDRRANV